jgi:hypothetical protein
MLPRAPISEPMPTTTATYMAEVNAAAPSSTSARSAIRSIAQSRYRSTAMAMPTGIAAMARFAASLVYRNHIGVGCPST